MSRKGEVNIGGVLYSAYGFAERLEILKFTTLNEQ